MTVKRRVYIVANRRSDTLYHNMFIDKGWIVTNSLLDADLVQFTGGEDVSPYLYGEELHNKTMCNINRDKKESLIFHIALAHNKPMAGICRGGQFLNVMCGGTLWQHVNGHANASLHEVIDLISGEVYRATSTHHQMMKPAPYAKVIGVAFECTWKESCHRAGTSNISYIDNKNPRYEGDMEILFYNNALDRHSSKDVKEKIYKACRVLCFQPHPEFKGFPDLADRYFDYVDDLLFAS